MTRTEAALLLLLAFSAIEQVKHITPMPDLTDLSREEN